MLIGKRREAVIPGRIDEVHELHVIIVFGGLLSLNTGWINAVAYRGFDGGITHVEGPAQYIGMGLATADMQLFLRSTAKFFAFLVGAILCGGYLGRQRIFRGGPRFAHILLAEAAAIFFAFVAERFSQTGRSQWNLVGALLLAMSAGLQNALTTIYSGAVVRTGNVTGIVTDLSLELGTWLFQNDRSGLWRAKIYAVLFLCFILGGFLGAVVFDPEAVALGAGVDFARAEAQALLVPAGGTFALGLCWLAGLARAAEPDARGVGLLAEIGVWPSETPSEWLRPLRSKSITMLGLSPSQIIGDRPNFTASAAA